MSVALEVQPRRSDSKAQKSPLSLSLKHLSNDQLVHSIQNGDAEALAELLARFRPNIMRWAYHLTHNLDEAEDVTAATCLRVCKSIHTCRQQATVAAWMNRIVRNVWLDRVRMQQRRAEVPIVLLEAEAGVLVGAPTHPQEFNEPLRAALEEDQRHEVQQAMNQLTACQQRIVHLFYLQGYTYEEVSVILQIPVGTIKSRLHRAKGLLRAHLMEAFSGLGA